MKSWPKPIQSVQLPNFKQRSLSATETIEEGRKPNFFQYQTLHKGNLIHGKMWLWVANSDKPQRLWVFSQKTHLASGNTEYKVPCYCCCCIPACLVFIAIQSPLHFIPSCWLSNYLIMLISVASNCQMWNRRHYSKRKDDIHSQLTIRSSLHYTVLLLSRKGKINSRRVAKELVATLTESM